MSSKSVVILFYSCGICKANYRSPCYVKYMQVLSGDAIVIRGQPRGGPPPTRTVALSYIIAPRLARRGNPNVEGSSDSVDEVTPTHLCVQHYCVWHF